MQISFTFGHIFVKQSLLNFVYAFLYVIYRVEEPPHDIDFYILSKKNTKKIIIKLNGLGWVVFRAIC